MEKSQMCKIGIIGPKPYFIGGHDNNTQRINIQEYIEKQLIRIKNEYESVIGLTGLGLGVEQDFAELCYNNNIDYYIYQSIDDPVDLWVDLSVEIKQKYMLLLNSSIKIINIINGIYSPKKNILKREKVIEDADVVIYVPYNILSVDTYFLNKIKASEKKLLKFE